jgi:hypothetical protein
MPLSKIYEDSVRSSKFQDVVNLLKTDSVTVNAASQDTAVTESALKPWTDQNMGKQRNFGGLNDSVGSGSGLLGNTTTALALLYAINNYQKNLSDPLINRYINAINEYQSSNTTTLSFLKRLELAMSNEYHGFNGSLDVNHSKNRPAGLYQELYEFRRSLNPVEGKSAIRYISQIMEIRDETNTDTLYYGTDAIYLKKGVVPQRVKKADVDALLYNAGGFTIGGSGLINSAEFPNLTVTGDCASHPVFKNLGSDATQDVTGHFYGSDNYQFSKNTIANLNDISNIELKGKWVLTKNGNMTAPYSSGNWFNETDDLSGIIRLPKSDDGCYYDFYINGVEVPETMVDTETGNTDRYAANFDASGTYVEYSSSDDKSNYYLSEDIKLSRKIDIRDEIKKFHLVNAGIFQFLRVGEVVHFFANSEDIDAEGNPALKFPVMKVAERGDDTGKCQLVIDDAYVPLKDVQSELTLTINPSRNTMLTNSELGSGFDLDASGVFVSRWSTTYLPLDVSGGLERGETFQLSLKDDSWVGDGASMTANNGTYDSIYSDPKQLIPAGNEDQKMVIQYRNKAEGNPIWRSAEGVTFEYECHNKNAADPDLGPTFNSYGGSNNEYSKSSNIKGLPEFRICLPPQSKLLALYNNTSGGASSFENAFGTLGRTATIELKYTKSGKLNSDGTKDVDGNNQTELVKFIVDSDQYDPKISVASVTYDNQGKQTIVTEQAIRTASNASNYTGYINTSGFAGKKVVGHATKLQTGPEQEVPDMTKLAVYTLDKSNFTHLNGNNKRLFEFVDLDFNENNHGVSKPIAQINVSNFLQENGTYGASASIVPIFKYAEDEKDFDAQGKYCLEDNNININATLDASSNVPRLIPANNNYGIYFTDDNTKLWLYRNKNLNYEEWVGGNDGIYTYNNYYESGTPHREVVHVKVVYTNPQASNLGNTGERNEASILFFVEPKDVKELHYPSNFHFTVQEGDKSVDISPILSATMEGKSSNKIEYYIRGIVDESGMSKFFAATATESVDELRLLMDASKIDTSVAADMDIGLTIDPVSTYSVANGLAGTAMMHKNLADELVNGKLMLYHENHNSSASSNINNKFDAYERQIYKFYVEAKYNVQDQSNTENALSLVTIEVENTGTDFFLADNTKWYHSVTETMGTIAEGKGRSGNNPDIPMSTFLNNLRHEDIGGGVTNLYNTDNVTFRIAEIDPALEVIQANNTSTDFSQQIIRLKDIDSNKTTETATEPSTKLAPYPHYNYERQTDYQITLEVCLTNNFEINVEKVPVNYVCGLGETASVNSFAGRTGADQNKTCTYLIKQANNTMFNNSDPADFEHQGKLYYFKDSETGLYQGPLSVLPQNMEDLHSKVKIHTVEVDYAYIRFDQADNGYTALYKAKGFRKDLTKPPKPQDICLQPFSIKVINSFDKPKVSPQPYKLAAATEFGYRRSDPNTQQTLDSDNMTATEGKNHVAYVFTDHKELDLHNGKDLPNEFKVPEWFADYKKPSDLDYTETSNNTTQFNRQIHPDCSMNNTNAGYNNGLYNGTFDTEANGSWEFGKFAQTGANDAVILDYFVEYHERIDVSGTNTIFTGKTPFGTLIDYSGTLPYIDGGVEATDSDKRMYRLANINRSRKHTNDNSEDSYYATAELQMGETGKTGDVYTFSVVAVSNVLATQNDLKYNKNMVDWNETFYPKVSQQHDGTAAASGKKYPQPFQKYTYDRENNKIVTLAHANNYSVNMTGTHNNMAAINKGVLLCCRTHFTVSVKADGDNLATTITAKTGNYEATKTITGSGSLQIGSVVSGVINTEGNISPLETIVKPTEGDLRLFDLGNGKVAMGMYQNGKWILLN